MHPRTCVFLGAVCLAFSLGSRLEAASFLPPPPIISLFRFPAFGDSLVFLSALFGSASPFACLVLTRAVSDGSIFFY